ncbi:hypothetical protein KEM48_007450 [Puccinia striiformis f. sp. tritici PST-130]|nr:hypothetical protein H4Q26_007515 [Puccinia striiformis f. sp. tritici PST-130]KAI9622137.1 hypothetical protein KEM48_007450 [Puccinia striiformis f. sp. tritici PST-130]
MIERLISPAVQFCARSDTIRPEKPAAESSNDSDDDELKKPVAAKVKRESLARQSRPEAQVISTFLIGFYRMLLKVLPLLGRLKLAMILHLVQSRTQLSHLSTKVGQVPSRTTKPVSIIDLQYWAILVVNVFTTQSQSKRQYYQ